MRPTLRLFAAVKPGRFLEAGNPTGLTGLATHPSPRPYLLYVYSATLERLRSIPESSVYRQSTEALTKHRMKIVEAAIPAGFEEWQKRIAEKIEKNPEAFAQSGHQVKLMGQDAFIQSKEEQEEDLDYREWDGEKGSPTLEGPRTERAGDFNAAQTSIERPDPSIVVALEPEPPLDVSQYVKLYPAALSRHCASAQSPSPSFLTKNFTGSATSRARLVRA